MRASSLEPACGVPTWRWRHTSTPVIGGAPLRRACGVPTWRERYTSAPVGRRAPDRSTLDTSDSVSTGSTGWRPQRGVSSAISASAARSTPAASTSRWVTMRSRCGPIAPMRTPAVADRLHHVGGRPVAGPQVDEVGLHLVEVDRVGDRLGDAGGEVAGVGVVVREAVDVVLERVPPRRGEHARLPHRTAEASPPEACHLDDLRVTDRQRTDRRPEPLGEADAERGEGPTHLDGVVAGRDQGVPQASPVPVQRDAAVVGHGTQLAQPLEPVDRSSPAVGGLLDADRGHLGVGEGGGSQRGTDRVGIEPSPLPVDGPELHLGVDGGGAGLVGHHVRVRLADHLAAGGGEGPQQHLRRHDPGGGQHRGLAAEPTRDLLLERPDRGILAVDVVPDLGLGHGAPHPRRRPGHGVAAQVDDVGHREVSQSSSRSCTAAPPATTPPSRWPAISRSTRVTRPPASVTSRWPAARSQGCRPCS
jgi:hypothetical protein